MSELKFQIKVCEMLNKLNYYYFAVPNGGNLKSVVNAMNLKRSGMKNGVSDLIVLRPGGRTYFLELKTRDGSQRKEQKIFQAIVESLGFKYYLVKPDMDFMKMIEEMK